MAHGFRGLNPQCLGSIAVGSWLGRASWQGGCGPAELLPTWWPRSRESKEGARAKREPCGAQPL